MINIFDRKFEFHALMIHPKFVYWQLNDYYTNWIEPPPGVKLRFWVNSFCEVFGNYLDIRVAARGLLSSKILWLCKERKSVETGIYPTLTDVYYLLNNTKYPLMTNTARYRETLLNRLDSLFSVFDEQLCSQKKLDWNNFLTIDWAISLDGVPTDYQNLFITVTVAKIMMYRMMNNLRSNRLIDLFVFDEASTIFKKWFDSKEQTFLLSDYLAKAREFGVGFLISTQGLTRISDSVMANSGIKILVGGEGLGTDYDIFASATGMSPEQKQFIKQMTMPGQAVVKDLRYPQPFTLEVQRIA
ncbi:MAG: hypothetical protein KAR42_13750 [candidate division Zixibacteria bacterium]|nr:hypothetical protein [candidate division Zixibacteria bacterium]